MTTKITTGRKLRIARETVKPLSSSQLGEVQGASDTIYTNTGSYYACTDCTSMGNTCRFCIPQML